MASDTKGSARHPWLGEEGLFLLLVKAVKRFLARLCQGFSPIPASQADTSGPAPVNASAASVLSETRCLHGTEEAPLSTLNSVQRSVSAMIETIDLAGLFQSLEAASALPQSERHHALRALLQQNFSDSHRIREACTTLNHRLEAEIASFAAAHHFSMSVELKRLESALADLTHAREWISTRAMASGAYTREELTTLMAQHGFDTAFLFQTEMEKPARAQASIDSISDGHLFGLDAGIQVDELDVFFENSAPQNTRELKKEPRPNMRA